MLKLIFDLTNYDSALKSQLEFLNLNEEDIEIGLDFVYIESTDVEDFFRIIRD